MFCAIVLGTRKIAEPMMVPTTMLVASNNPSLRGNSRGRFVVVRVFTTWRSIG
jgi:hypothetical protein